MDSVNYRNSALPSPAPPLHTLRGAWRVSVLGHLRSLKGDRERTNVKSIHFQRWNTRSHPDPQTPLRLVPRRFNRVKRQHNYPAGRRVFGVFSCVCVACSPNCDSSHSTRKSSSRYFPRLCMVWVCKCVRAADLWDSSYIFSRRLLKAAVRFLGDGACS